MIKKTFYNLPDDKRQRIIDAIMMEFSSSTSEKVSINRIIKNANISRGSFYQYFDDKVDLVEILTKVFVNKSIDRANIVLQKTNGDIFYTYAKLFDILTDLANDEKNKTVLKNLLNNIKANDNLISEYFITRYDCNDFTNEITTLFNTDNLKYKDKEDIKFLSQILSQVLKNAIFDHFVLGEDCEKIKISYLRKLEIIKSGAIAEE